MNIKNLLIITPLLLVLLLLWGCEAEHPGSPLPNKPPDTRIVVAPLEGTEHDHYISPTKLFHIQWFGSDPDGEVVRYLLKIDDNEVWTTATDSDIAFEAALIDSSDTTYTRLKEDHLISVTAEDNLGAVDPTPATRMFYAVNYAPRITDIEADFADQDTVGRGINFEVEWADENVSDVLFRLYIDGGAVTEWDARTKYQFCDTSNEDILASVETSEVYPVDISFLRPGSRTLSAKAMDLGGAISDESTVHLIVSEDVAPEITDFSAVYGNSNFFPDGSVFYVYRDDITTTTVNVTGSAESYFGTIQAYRAQVQRQAIEDTSDWGEWPEWYDEISPWGNALGDYKLDLGRFRFRIQCRDFTGKISEPYETSLTIVQPDYSEKTILIIDETFNGNGPPGVPTDSIGDAFWTSITQDLLDEWTISYIDYDIDGPVSPLHVYDKRIIIWHGDDDSQILLKNNLTLLSEYLTGGGKLIISGMNILGNFTTDTEATSLTFTSGFASRYLRITGGKKNTAMQFIGMAGNADIGCPDVSIDPDKLFGRWRGRMKNCWTVIPDWRSEVVGRWRGDPEAETYLDFEDEPCCVRNFSAVYPWRTIILGFPLFFTYDDQAREFINWAIEELEE